MSNVVELKPRLTKRNGLARQIGAALGPAKILLFSGVQYERWGEPDAHQEHSEMAPSVRLRESAGQ